MQVQDARTPGSGATARVALAARAGIGSLAARFARLVQGASSLRAAGQGTGIRINCALALASGAGIVSLAARFSRLA